MQSFECLHSSDSNKQPTCQLQDFIQNVHSSAHTLQFGGIADWYNEDARLSAGGVGRELDGPKSVSPVHLKVAPMANPPSYVN